MTIALLTAFQRSGTGALGTVLNQHGQVSYLGEVFLEHDRGQIGNFNSFFLDLIRENPEFALPSNAPKTFGRYVGYLETVVSKPIKVIDIKYNCMHHLSSMVYDHHCLALAVGAGLPIIHLIRRNFLKALVSLDLALINDIWHASLPDALPRRTLQLATVGLVERLDVYASESAMVSAYLRNYGRSAQFDYEEMFNAEGELSVEVETFLVNLLDIDGFENRRPHLVKQTHDDLAMVIENYDEVANVLSATPYQWMLRD
ncbi:MAG TPA: hypothetical protein VF701_05040 [Thermoanaerobaculia bacterium]